MKRFNKATATALSGAVTALLVALTDMPPDAVAATGATISTFLVWLVPNKE